MNGVLRLAITSGVAAVVGIGMFVLMCLLIGCVPPGMNISGPGIGIEGGSHKPSDMKAGTCMVEGQMVLTTGTQFSCGPSGKVKAKPPSDPADADTPATTEADPEAPADDEAEEGPVDETEPSARDPPDPDPPAHGFAPNFGIDAAAATPAADDFDLVSEIRRDEGGRNVLYCDSSGAHIGDGHKIVISDKEREDLLCVDVAEAEEQAQRVIGAFFWDGLDQVRRDVWIVVCYWSVCAGFDKALHATRAGDYKEAGRQLLLNKAEDGPSEIMRKHPDRARKYARWMETGERT